MCTQKKCVKACSVALSSLSRSSHALRSGRLLIAERSTIPHKADSSSGPEPRTQYVCEHVCPRTKHTYPLHWKDYQAAFALKYRPKSDCHPRATCRAFALPKLMSTQCPETTKCYIRTKGKESKDPCIHNWPKIPSRNTSLFGFASLGFQWFALFKVILLSSLIDFQNTYTCKRFKGIICCEFHKVFCRRN